jgi:hypothetical protein
MLGWWANNSCFPEYINCLKDTQKKATRASLLITDAWLVAIATVLLLLAGSFPKLRLDWDGLSLADKMWPAWKTWALKAQKTTECKECASNSCGDIFGSASATITVHSITFSPPHLQAANATNHSLPNLSKLKSHLDNMAFTVTNEKAVLDSLVSSNASLAKITSEMLTKLKNLLLRLKLAGPWPSSGTPQMTVPSNSCNVSQLRVGIKHRWVPGAFCSTPGWCVGAGHTSPYCNGKRHGHIDSATHDNPQGSDATKNKGCDDFLNAG